MPKPTLLFLLSAIVAAGLFQLSTANASQIPVRHKEGVIHGFLVLRTMGGEALADGDSVQFARGERVTNHLVYHFKDGSIHDETAVFSQSHEFRLLTYHLIQKGPSFPHPMEVAIDTSTNYVTIHYSEGGKEKVRTDHLQLPMDIGNGMVPIFLKNVAADAAETTVSMVAATPKPRLIELVITRQGEDTFSTGAASHKSIHYVVKIKIGGVAGAVAPLLGKQPPDIHVWMLSGEAPVFLKSEGPLYFGGPVWRTELVSPVWK